MIDYRRATSAYWFAAGVVVSPTLKIFAPTASSTWAWRTPKEADAVRFIAVHAGLKNAAHLIDPQRIVKDFPLLP